ncbi:hypothetical protein AHAS_Ahas10G0128300 [Arachis hypogaea]
MPYEFLLDWLHPDAPYHLFMTDQYLISTLISLRIRWSLSLWRSMYQSPYLSGIFLKSRSQCLRLSPHLRSCTPPLLLDRRVWARAVVRVSRPLMRLLRFLMMKTRILRSVQM